jgi:plastocyanin domain-containing protein
MEKLMQWINDNKEWVFSGIGLALIGLIWKFFFKDKSASGRSQTIRSGRNSTNFQAGRDINKGKLPKRRK